LLQVTIVTGVPPISWTMSLLSTKHAFSRICRHVRRHGRSFSAVHTDNSSDFDENLKSKLPYQSKPLGSPLPFDEHACSVSLPTWCSVVGYEEGDETVTSAMICGYPRFFYHPYIIQLMQVFLDRFSDGKEDCLVLPTKEAALRCQIFLQGALEKGTAMIDNAAVGRPEHESPGEGEARSRIRVEALEEAGVYAVVFPAETAAGIEAKAYWQHTGELVSSRRAELALTKLGYKCSSRVTCCPVKGTPTIYHTSEGEDRNPQDEDSAQSQLKERIAGWTKAPAENVFLVPSGMASMYKSLRSSRRYQLEKYPASRGGKSIVFGFPYLDTLKLCSRPEFSPSGVEFFGMADATDLQNLEKLLNHRASSRWSGLFTEVPSNPLLQCPDLEKLRELADEHDFCMVVDDTIGNFLNIDLIESGLADAVCTSLTKLVSGRGDAIAGSVVCNPHTEKGRWMKEDMSKDTDIDGGLFEADARAILHNSADFEERNDVVNESSEKLADFLNEHPDVETVWYPKLVAPLYSKYRKKGYGGVISIHLHPHICQRTFYDALDVAKGPSLGTNFTLVCPYTLLAHYHELDFALSYNVPPNLIRIAVGLEDYDELKGKFEYALEKSRLHPKINIPVSSQF
jgi:cystathionine gamma-synthase